MHMKEKVILNGSETMIEQGMTLKALAKTCQNDFKGPIVLAVVNGKLSELYKKVKHGSTIQFLDTTSHDGYRTYQRSLSFLLIKSIRDILDGDQKTISADEAQVKVHFAINNGYYCEIEGLDNLDDQFITGVKHRMRQLIDEDHDFVKTTVHLNEARSLFKKQKMDDKLELFKYRKASNVNLYHLDGFYDYFYGYMVPSTGCLGVFDVFKYHEGLVLQFMLRDQPETVAEFSPDQKLFETMYDSMAWAKIMNIYDVGTLNNMVSAGDANEMILVMEALMEKRIGQIADKIAKDIQNKKFIFIAGPSSSGKTTFAHRLGIQMKAHGVKPYVISVDNYFKRRVETPVDADGNYDFECLEAIRVEAFNKDMMSLLKGERVDIPNFNFISGEPEYQGNFMKMGENDILIIEGIHGLNDKLSYSIPVENKFKIYISALTQLNVDNHNRVPTTDTRLIRRIVRDNQYRGASAKKTISMWPSVRHGEDNYIFPFQEGADVMFNSALIYELAVLKQYAEPLLLNVPQDSKEYIEAKRLVKFLDYFMTIPSESIPMNSLLREFIGGSCFR